MKYKVNVIKIEDDCCVKSYVRDSLWQAEKLKRGLSLNLNHEDYYIKIIEIYK